MTDERREQSRADAEATPAPDGRPLRLTMTCRTSREPGAPSARHSVVIQPDWRVEVPHDLEAERLAMAFGGYLSCVSLADNAVPALRAWLARATRRDLPAVTFRGEVDRWAITEPTTCCHGKTHRDAVAAAEHWRSPQHVATVHGAIPRQVTTLAAASQRAHAGTGSLAMPPEDRDRAAQGCLGGANDVAWLWDAGIHPRLVWTIHDRLATGHPLPARFYLGVAWNRPDLRWVAGTLAGLDDPEEVHASLVGLADPTMPSEPEPLVTWLAWTAQNWDVVDPTARYRWIGTGITRKLILALGEAGYDPDDVAEHARAVNRTPDAVARTLRQWLEAGFHPSPASLTALAATGVPAHTVPSRAAVDRLRSATGSAGSIWSLTDLALILAQHGTVAQAAWALRYGAQPC